MTGEISVINKENVIIIGPDGTITFIGPEWRSCPRPEKPCPRPPMFNRMPDFYDKTNEKCRHCVYSGTGYLDSQEQGLKVALLIYPEGKVIS